MTTGNNDILAAIKKNRETGFRQLVAGYKEPVYWHIRRLVVSHDDAQDATQETFVRIFRSLDQYGGEHSFTAWIYRIATNEALRLLERRSRNLFVDLDEASGHIIADDYVDYSDVEAVKLQEAIRTLPSKQQAVFNMRYYDEMSYDDIAAALESSAGAVKTNYHLAKEKIVKFMKQND